MVQLKINRKKFFDAYRNSFGSFNQGLVDAIENLIDFIEIDPKNTDSALSRRQIAYLLATIKHETANTFLPIHEYGDKNYFNSRYGPQNKVGQNLGNTQSGDGARYAGRGYVQLTGRKNYARASRNTGIDLINNPDRAMEPSVAYKIISTGMREGWFTGHRLSGYITDRAVNFIGARRIINGTDKAGLIAKYAVTFNRILMASIETVQENKSVLNQVEDFYPSTKLKPINEAWSSAADFIDQQTDKISGVVKESVTEIKETASGTIEKQTSAITSTFEPQNLPAFLPRFGKQWLLGLIPAGFSASTLYAYAQSAPVWLVFLLGALTGVAITCFFLIFWAHRKFVANFVLLAYQSLADPAQNNLIVTSARGFIGNRKAALLNALEKENNSITKKPL